MRPPAPRSRIDECQEWADKAAALSSYAKQADDETLHRYAERIKARAIRRCGELLKQVQPAKNQHAYDGGGISRSKAATDAGLSERQKVTALRVASVPLDEFASAVESDSPPTITELAERGTAKLRGTASIEQFRAASKVIGRLRDFAQFIGTTDPVETAHGVQPAEIRLIKKQVSAIDSWLDRFVVSLKDGGQT
jgi:hypothetical protein